MEYPDTRAGYKIIEEIDRTLLSVVSKAKLKGLSIEIALKQVFNPAHIRDIQDEFSVLKDLEHPNLPHYYQVFEDNGHGYLVMEFIPGKNLKEVLIEQKGPLPEVLVCSYAVQLCNALSYLHNQQPNPISHRDIKPANIRITPNGLIKLVDFGLLKQGIGATKTSRRMLTENYAPTEQWRHDEKSYGNTDQRSDIYSLAATFYHLLSGVPPARSNSRVEYKTPLKPLPEYVSPHVVSAITKAMALHKSDRYANAQEFLSALLAEELVSAPIILPEKGSTTLSDKEISGPTIKVLSVSVKFLRTLKGHTHSVDSVAFSPNAPLLASASGEGTVRLWNIDSGKEIRSLKHIDAVTDVAFKPNGQLLASASLDKVYLWDFESGDQLRELAKHRAWVNGVAFSPNGTMLASASKRVGLWDMKNEGKGLLLEGHKSRVTSVVFSPNGQMVVSASHDKTVRWWDVNSGREMEERRITHHKRVIEIALSKNGDLMASVSRNDPIVHLWDLSSGQQVRRLEHPASVRSVAFHPNKPILASVGADHIVYLWDVDRGVIVERLTEHRDKVQSVAFSPDGDLLASASTDKTVILWNIN